MIRVLDSADSTLVEWGRQQQHGEKQKNMVRNRKTWRGTGRHGEEEEDMEILVGHGDKLKHHET